MTIFIKSRNTYIQNAIKEIEDHINKDQLKNPDTELKLAQVQWGRAYIKCLEADHTFNKADAKLNELLRKADDKLTKLIHKRNVA